MSTTVPARGDIWMLSFDPIRGHEQAGTRPALVVSDDRFNRSPAGLIIVVPTTTKGKSIPWHIEIAPPEGGLRQRSFAKCEDIRSVATERLGRRLGSVSPQTLSNVEDRLRVLLKLGSPSTSRGRSQ